MIDELGKICYCSYGIWKYDLIKNYIDADFSVRFKEVKKIFTHSLSSCTDCYRIYLNLKDQFDI